MTTPESNSIGTLLRADPSAFKSLQIIDDNVIRFIVPNQYQSHEVVCISLQKVGTIKDSTLCTLGVLADSESTTTVATT